MGWPGQGEVEAAAPTFDMEFQLPMPPPPPAALDAAGAAQLQLQLQQPAEMQPGLQAAAAAADADAGPAGLQLEDGWRPNNRQLGYVTVTRPLRQVGGARPLQRGHAVLRCAALCTEAPWRAVLNGLSARPAGPSEAGA